MLNPIVVEFDTSKEIAFNPFGGIYFVLKLL